MPVPFDKDLLVAIRPTMESILMAIAIVSLILDISICKWRKLVNLCLYLEMLYSTCTLSFGILTLQNETQNTVVAGINLMLFVLFYCDSASQIVFTCLNLSFFSFIVLPVIFLDEFSFASVMIKLITIFGLFFILSLLTMILSYISKLHERMQMQIVSNKKLLNGMHEGLLILSKADNNKNVLFCNRPVRTLLASALNSHIET